MKSGNGYIPERTGRIMGPVELSLFDRELIVRRMYLVERAAIGSKNGTPSPQAIAAKTYLPEDAVIEALRTLKRGEGMHSRIKCTELRHGS